ncbi:lasso peptide biosynthesis PqqD family chaperone [Streptomyces sp. SCL15-4]|uniref:lasso peptide biosynthesis PqqD family chaperone n=1 Tax=Streptomyces sp. SCL15-4 TaxID=2967221 RepID=UPI002965D9B7|nr:lasso peptide biosynthesis PqqD family chaperone [Streptomyces sp. SCL15-4]
MRLAESVSALDTDDGTVLLHERSGKFYQLNSTGSEVLSRLLGGERLPDVVGALAERTGAGREKVHRDVAELVDRLHGAGLVTP